MFFASLTFSTLWAANSTKARHFLSPLFLPCLSSIFSPSLRTHKRRPIFSVQSPSIFLRPSLKQEFSRGRKDLLLLLPLSLVFDSPPFCDISLAPYILLSLSHIFSFSTVYLLPFPCSISDPDLLPFIVPLTLLLGDLCYDIKPKSPDVLKIANDLGIDLVFHLAPLFLLFLIFLIGSF